MLFNVLKKCSCFFLKWVGDILKSVISILIVVFLFLAGFSIWAQSYYEQKPVRPNGNSFLFIDFSKVKKTNDEISYQELFQPKVDIKIITDAIQAAENDNNILGIFAYTGNSQLSFADCQEVMSYIKSYRKKTNKPTYVFSQLYNRINYLLASSFETIYIQPSGEIDFTGFSDERYFLKDFFENIGVHVDYLRRYEYKGAIETYTQERMSNEVKSNLQALQEDMFSQYKEAVSINRKITKDVIDNIFLKPFVLPWEAKRVGLVSEVAYVEDFINPNNAKVKPQWISVVDYLSSKPKKLKKHKIGFIKAEGVVTSSASGVSIYNESYITPKKLVQNVKRAVQSGVDGLVIYINSPGGSHIASDSIWHSLKQIKEENNIPLAVIMGNVAASGGYYIAMASDYIVAQPSTITGSIGVYMAKFSFEDLSDLFGVRWSYIDVGPRSNIDKVSKKLSLHDKEILNASIDDAYRQFLAVVKEARNISLDKIDDIARGRVFSGYAAYKNGLVDALGGKEQVKAFFAKKFNVKNVDIDLIDMTDKVDPLEYIWSTFFNLQINSLLNGFKAVFMQGGGVMPEGHRRLMMYPQNF